MKLELKKFEARNLKYDSTCIFIAKRNTGKSFALRDIMWHMRELPCGTVISPTESANEFFGKFIPGVLIYEEYSPDIIAKFVERQRRITEQYNAEVKKYGRSDIDPRSFLILDDCMYDKGWINDKNIRYLFMNGRHVHVFFAITLQYAMGIPPTLRGNVDYVFLFREPTMSMREKLYKQYAGMFPSFDVFNQVMNACTQNYEVLVLDNRTQSNALTDQVYWWKATAREFKMCSAEFWQIQAMEEERKALGLKKDEDDEEEYNPMIMKKKNSPVIKVRKAN